MRAIDFILEEKSRRPYEFVGNLQVGDYIIKIEKHILDRMSQRDWSEQDVLSTLNKLPKAKAKLKQLVPGEMFYLHDNTNNLFVRMSVKNTDRKIYVAQSVMDRKFDMYRGARIPIIEVA